MKGAVSSECIFDDKKGGPRWSALSAIKKEVWLNG